MPSASPGNDVHAASSAGGESVSSRRLRKRELDRNAQRNARERTKNRIAYLERLVEDLRHENAGGPVARLMEQLSEVTQERDNLSKAMRTIENVLKTTNLQESGVLGLARPSASFDSDAKMDSSSDAGALRVDTPPTSASPENVGKPEPPEDVIYPAESECDCAAERAAVPQKELNRWRFANQVLTVVPELTGATLDREDETAEDTPVRAMIEGWAAVEARGRLPPLWQKLRQIDEVLFSSCSKVERLAIMWLMHLLYRFHSGPTETRKADVPKWYLNRPSQDNLRHSYAINFFAWPGLRERFIFSQHRYCGNEFWHLFARCAVVLWPYEFRDCYTYNTETGDYAMSGAFEKNVRDINCWTMKSDMYERWPEMRSDIPAFLEVARSLPDPQKGDYDGRQEQQLVHPQPIGNLWGEAQALGSWPMQFPGGAFVDDTSFDPGNFFTMLPTMPSGSFPQHNNTARTSG